MLDAQRDANPPPAPREVRRLDYRPPAWLVDTVRLHFDLHTGATRVRAELAIRRNPAHGEAVPLRLDGEGLRLLALSLDGEALHGNRFTLEPGGALVVPDVPEAFTLATEVQIDPAANTELSGLYVSDGSFFTQCEAEGFRRITFFPDRPDVMARFTTTVSADARACPVLLSNGNPEARGETADGRHWVRWVDPHPEAVLSVRAGRRRPRGGPRQLHHALRPPGGARHLGAARRRGSLRARHARRSRPRCAGTRRCSGCEYDLDVFNIAAVSDFNMGAMENKGLNVFNTKYVLARPETATDVDYQGIETVIAHEYFHNWTGNRVTCRDWFQLSLKEGLTVFRDQEFTADQGSRAVKRLADVRRLRAAQFPEDDGPLAHPVRPDSYIAIDNFYTATVYQKGAEVVRMMHTLTGRDGFRRGMDLYFDAPRQLGRHHRGFRRRARRRRPASTCRRSWPGTRRPARRS